MPGWAREKSLGARTINARAETLKEKLDPRNRDVDSLDRLLVPYDTAALVAGRSAAG